MLSNIRYINNLNGICQNAKLIINIFLGVNSIIPNEMRFYANDGSTNTKWRKKNNKMEAFLKYIGSLLLFYKVDCRCMQALHYTVCSTLRHCTWYSVLCTVQCV